MHTKLVKIGNSQGLLIPKRLLTSLGEVKKFDIHLKDGGIFLLPSIDDSARHDWEKLFSMALENGYKPEDAIEDFGNDFDNDDWTW
jgi:antitoxin MazE